MTDAVETMAWKGEVPWRGLGTEVTGIVTADEMLRLSGLDWSVSKRAIKFEPHKGKKLASMPKQFVLARDTDDMPLSIVGGHYKPVQNVDSMGFFKRFVEAGHMSLETAGSLYSGRYIWALARIGVDFAIGKKNEDEMRGYLLLCNPHVFGKAMIIQFTPIRVVCWNTLTWALGADLKGSGTGSRFSMPHSMEFNDGVKARAEQALGLAKHQMADFKAMATHLSKKKAKPADVEEYFAEVLHFDPEQAHVKKPRTKAEAKKIIEPRMLGKLRMALEQGPGAQLGTAAHTWWGALNAVTFVVDHQLGSNPSAVMRTAWLGQKAGMKRRAVELAVARAA